MTWTIDSWNNFIAKHGASYGAGVSESTKYIRNLPALVSFESIVSLRYKLATLEDSNGFIVQMGECAERFDQASLEHIKAHIDLVNDFVSKLCQTNILNRENLVKIGRIAGQYAKPRNDEFEYILGKSLPIYKGDLVNSFSFDDKLRQHDHRRMIEAYKKSKYTLNIIKNYEGDGFFTSHEALILEYESSLTRMQHVKNKDIYYASSGHFLWLGERTRFLDSAHVEYLSGIFNPIGIKVSASTDVLELIRIIRKLNPDNESGKVVLISRMGSRYIKEFLPKVVNKIKESGLRVLWVCDPMHGNTIKLENGIKTRLMDDIVSETRDFWKILGDLGVFIAGIHLEVASGTFVECINLGMEEQLLGNNTWYNYESYCDPRLNAEQTSVVAAVINDIMKLGY